jgi:hypothetical protein
MTQNITKGERAWRVFEPDHRNTTASIGSKAWRQEGWAALEVDKGADGRLHICATEHTGQSARNMRIILDRDTVRSMIEWLNTYAQEPATNGGDERPATELPRVANNPESPLP